MALFGNKSPSPSETALPDSAPEGDEYVVMPKQLRDALARLRGREPLPDDQVVPVLASKLSPNSFKMALEARERAATLKKAQQEMLKTAVIGQLIPGKGIYGGVWEPKDRKGESLGKKFALWWDAHDLRDASGRRVCLTFEATVATLAGQKDGLNISHENYDTLLYQALRDGSAIGKRFIPPCELVCGRDIDDNQVFSEPLYENHDVGAFRDNGGFVTDRRFFGTGSDRKGYPVRYWSGTISRADSSCVWSTDFSEGEELPLAKNGARLSCRPVRVESLDI